MSQGFDPSGIEILNRARALLQSGSIDEALTMLHTYVSGNPKSSEGFELIGVAYAQKGMMNEGIQALITSVNLNPGSASCRVNLAVAFQRAERIPEAIKQFQDALVIDPNNARAKAGLTQLNVPVPISAPAYSPPPGAQYGATPNAPYGAPQNPYAPPAGAGYYPPPGGGVPPYPGSGYTSAPVYDDPDCWKPMKAFEMFSNPSDFFRRQRGQMDRTKPMYYALIWAAISIVLNIVTGNSAFGMPNGRNPAADPAMIGGALVCGVPLGLAMMVVGIYIMAGYLHLFAMMFGRQPQFSGTFRAMIYSWTPTTIAGIIGALMVKLTHQPAINGIFGLIGLVATAYLLTVAYKEIHEMETGKAALAAILPLVVAVGIFVFLFAALFLAAAGAANAVR